MGDLQLFINRKREVEFLLQDAGASRPRSRLLFISAFTGIGKSALVDQVLPQFTHSNQYRVSISIDKQNEIQDGYFFKQITRLLHNNAKRSGNYWTIYEFISSDRFYKNVANGISKALMSYLKLDHFVDGFKEKNKNVNESIKTWLGDDEELLDVCYRYVQYVCSERKTYLAVENFQIIDVVSLSIIRDILINVVNVYLIAECTLALHENRISELINFFDSTDIDVNNLRLEKLDKVEILKSIENEKEILISIIERTYENSDGNLHKFKLLRNTNQAKTYDINLSNYNNVTKVLINSLSEAHLGVLTIILAHQSDVPLALIELYIKYSPSLSFLKEEYFQNLLDLQQLGLIKLSSQRVVIEHDSISLDIQALDKVKKVQIVVIRNWIRVYQYLERNTVAYEVDYVDNLLWQIYFVLKVGSLQELPDILERLNRYISISPTYNIVFQLDKIAESCKKHAFEELDSEVYKWLIIMYYRCGYSDRVIKASSPALLTDITILLCYMAALSTSDHEEVFRLLNELEADKSGALWLGLILIKIRNFRSADNFIECKNLWQEHYQRGTFVNTSFYAGFLKYCTLAEHENYNMRVSCLKQAMSQFVALNDKYGQISTCVALSRDSAYIGDLENCRSFIEKAEELANMSVYPRYQLYNNRAVFDIISESINQLTKDGLNNSLRICTNNGDKLIILSNILVVSIIERDTVYGYTIYSKLQKEILHNFDAKDTITHLCLYNCYRYALMIGENEQAKYLYDHLLRLEIRQDKELWRYLVFGDGENPFPNVVRKEYYPCFMISWDIDYYIALSNFRPKALEHH